MLDSQRLLIQRTEHPQNFGASNNQRSVPLLYIKKYMAFVDIG